MGKPVKPTSSKPIDVPWQPGHPDYHAVVFHQSGPPPETSNQSYLDSAMSRTPPVTFSRNNGEGGNPPADNKPAAPATLAKK